MATCQKDGQNSRPNGRGERVAPEAKKERERKKERKLGFLVRYDGKSRHFGCPKIDGFISGYKVMDESVLISENAHSFPLRRGNRVLIETAARQNVVTFTRFLGDKMRSEGHLWHRDSSMSSQSPW